MASFKEREDFAKLFTSLLYCFEGLRPKSFEKTNGLQAGTFLDTIFVLLYLYWKNFNNNLHKNLHKLFIFCDFGFG